MPLAFWWATPSDQQTPALDAFLREHGLTQHRTAFISQGYEDLEWLRRMPEREVATMIEALRVANVPPGHIGKLAPPISMP